MPGKQAIAFNKRDRYGNPVNLQALKGKYVLLDFWGSWCGPCRKGNPHLKALYEKYHDKGLEIIGIANERSATLNEARAQWIEAIQEDKLPWTQVLNDEGADQFDIVAVYGITSYPQIVIE